MFSSPYLRFLLVPQGYCDQLTQLWWLQIRENNVKVSQRYKTRAFPGGLVAKKPPSNARGVVLILVGEQRSHVLRGH